MNGATIENGERSSVSRTSQKGDIMVESNRRHTVDLGEVFPHDANGPIKDAPSMRVFFGSKHDAGIIGAPQPTQEIPPAVWRGCMARKAVVQMMQNGHLRVLGTVGG